MKKSNPNKQVINIYFNTSNHSSGNHRPKRNHGNGGSHHRNSYSGGTNHRSYNGNSHRHSHNNHQGSDRLAMTSIIASAAVTIVKILKQKNELDYLR